MLTASVHSKDMGLTDANMFLNIVSSMCGGNTHDYGVVIDTIKNSEQMSYLGVFNLIVVR